MKPSHTILIKRHWENKAAPEKSCWKKGIRKKKPGKREKLGKLSKLIPLNVLMSFTP